MALSWPGKVNGLRLRATRSDHVPVFDIQRSNRFRSERHCEHRLSLLHKCVLGPVLLYYTAAFTSLGKKNEGLELI